MLYFLGIKRKIQGKKIWQEKCNHPTSATIKKINIGNISWARGALVPTKQIFIQAHKATQLGNLCHTATATHKAVTVFSV